MVDLLAAARGFGWDARWLDLEGTLHATTNESLDEKRRVKAATVADVERLDPHLVLSYCLEYLEPVFQSYVPGFDTRFHEMIKRPPVFVLCDFWFPFDRGPNNVLQEYFEPLQGADSLVICWDRDVAASLKRAGVTQTIYSPLAVNDL